LLTRGDAAAALAYAQWAELVPETETGTGYVRYKPWAAKTALGRALVVLGRTAEAVIALESAVAVIEEGRTAAATDELARTAYLEDKLDACRVLARLYLEDGRTLDALRIADRIKGRTLADVAGQDRIDVAALITPAEQARERELEDRLGEVNRKALAATSEADSRAAEEEVVAARIELRRFRTQLHAAHPELLARGAAEVDDGIDLPRSLGDVAVVQYLIEDAQVFAFVMGPDAEVRVVEIAVRENELRARVESAMRKLQNRDVRYAEEARALYRLLVEPLPDDVLRRAALCIIPDGVLWQVPFQALLDGGDR
jgi:CHAT domain